MSIQAAVAVPALISGGASIIGGMKASSAAKKQAREQNAAVQRQFEYDTELWNMSKDKRIADHKFLLEGIEIQEQFVSYLSKKQELFLCDLEHHDHLVLQKQE